MEVISDNNESAISVLTDDTIEYIISMGDPWQTLVLCHVSRRFRRCYEHVLTWKWFGTTIRDMYRFFADPETINRRAATRALNYWYLSDSDGRNKENERYKNQVIRDVGVKAAMDDRSAYI